MNDKLTIVPRFAILIDGAHAEGGVPVEVYPRTAIALLQGGFADVVKTVRKPAAETAAAEPAQETATAAGLPAPRARKTAKAPKSA